MVAGNLDLNIYVNEVITKYILDGSLVLLETTGDEKIHYTYDSSNNLISMNIVSSSILSVNWWYNYVKISKVI